MASAQIPFSFFVSLLREIAKLPSRSAWSSKSDPSRSPVRKVLDNWITALRRDYSPLPRGTTATVARLLFPEEDVSRRYDLQETRLAQYLGKCLDSSTLFMPDAAQLKRWCKDRSSGCLGSELLEFAVPGTEDDVGPKSLQDIDALLDELASTSQFSDRSLREAYPSPRSKVAILRSLYDSLPASDATYLTQIILKDLRPLLYAPPASSTSAVLLEYNTASKHVLTKEQFMMSWDPSGTMLRMYRVRSKLDEAAMGFDARGALAPLPQPRCGVPIEVPKSAKGRSPQHALELLESCDQIWAETKYDGERAQIHVTYGEDGDMTIMIFSKSKRDSTLDRIAVHPIIKEALAAFTPQSIILDAEMVAFSEKRNAIDEFWRIRGLIASTAQGPRAGMTFGKAGQAHESESLDSCPSLHSNCSSDTEGLHLALVFFDVLLLGHASMLGVPYAIRRMILESAVRQISGRSMIAHRTLVSDNHEAGRTPQRLREVWAQHIADREEGLVLKAAESKYGDWKLPWVKLKKDYIPGYGDTIDLVVVGASWDKDRARELRVSPSTLTTFYIGALGNSSKVKANSNTRPHYVVYFTASYGLSREQLEEFNFRLRADEVDFSELNGLSYTYSVLHTLPKPSVFIRSPILVELCGAGFTKSAHCKYYELRFPRITKIFRPSERSFTECLTVRDLQTTAYAAIGCAVDDTKTYDDVEEWSRSLRWGTQKGGQSDVKGPQRKQQAMKDWELRLETADLQRRNGKRKHEEVEMSQ